MKRRIVLNVFWLFSLAAVGAWSHARKPQIPNREPDVIFGPQLGFRVDSHRARHTGRRARRARGGEMGRSRVWCKGQKRAMRRK